MATEDMSYDISPTDPLLQKFTVEFSEDEDTETIIDYNFDEDKQLADELNHIQEVLIKDLEDDNSNDNNNNTYKTNDDKTDNDMEIVVNNDDDLLLGSEIMTEKYLKNRQQDNNCDKNNDNNIDNNKDNHKKCIKKFDNERELRIELQTELELERQQRIHFQKLYEQHMNYSLKREFNDYKHIKTLKIEILKYRQQLNALKKSLKNKDNIEDINTIVEDNETLIHNKEKFQEFNCPDCSNTFKSEVSMILHIVNHCIEEQEFRLETTVFRLDEFSDSMIDSIRKSVVYCCPRCVRTFNSLDIYYHLYKCHTKERPIICIDCSKYFTHLDYWTEHNHLVHNGLIQSVNYIDISLQKHNSQTLRQSSNLSQQSGRKQTLPPNRKIYSKTNGNYSSKSYKSYSSIRTNEKIIRLSDKLNIFDSNPNEDEDEDDDEETEVEDEEDDDNDNENGSRSDSPEIITLDSPTPSPSVKQSSNIRTFSVTKPSISTNSNLPNNWNSRKTIESNFTCDFPDCDFKTTSREKLEFHVNAHTKSKYKCPYCPYVGNILNDILKHIQKSQKHKNSYVYKCRDCFFGINCRQTFTEHLKKRHFRNTDDEDVINDYITDMFRNAYSTNDS
ncbi:zinc finger protein 23-like [Oppia nitens]|uniref:zinc finger protein 23-like n=1 Tax=Oppia nitens TaxID=1686743 RepID=UPI0023DAE775|nr:zinc finger protein 23-like [Oppia nitens]